MGFIKNVVSYFQKSCPVCEGSGVTYCNCNEHFEITCPHCMGKGVIEKVVVSNNVVEVPCDHPGCQDGKVRCGYCGDGEKSSDEAFCSHCHGSKVMTCPVCGGTNRIERLYQEQWVKHEICPTCHGKAYIACPHCHGTKNRICPHCHGNGVVFDRVKCALAAAGVLFLIMMPMLAMTFMGFALAGSVLYLLYQHFPPSEKSKEEKSSDNDVLDKKEE